MSSRISNPSCHNLCETHAPPKNFCSLLGLGLKFCPSPDFTTGQIQASSIFHCFRDVLYTKIQLFHLCFTGDPWDPKQPYIRSPTWTPDPKEIPPEVQICIAKFEAALKPHFKGCTAPHNLIPPQRRRSLTNKKDVIVVPADKNLGPVILDQEVYVPKCSQNHLLTPTYQQLSQEFVAETTRLIEEFITGHGDNISENDVTHLEHYSELVGDRFAYFYALIKVHKTPWQTHPRIISVSGSALYGVGKWLDQQLQPFLKQLPTNISSSYDLINKIWTRCRAIPFSLIAQCSMFTGDIVSMYPTIDLDDAFTKIAEYLDSHPDCPNSYLQAILSALHLVMRRNCFRFW